MRNFFLMFGVLISISIDLFAAKEDVPMTIFISGHDVKNTTIKRAPMHVPFEITYDATTHTIEVRSEEELEADIYIKTEDGYTLGYSNCINTLLNVPYNFIGLLTISIESTEWTAEGELEIWE